MIHNKNLLTIFVILINKCIANLKRYMKHKYYVLVMFICFTNNCFSQHKDRICLSIGTNVPVGSFASKSPDNGFENKPGYANLGSVADLSFVFSFYKNFGFVTTFFSQSSWTNHHNLVSEMSQPTSQEVAIIEGSWEVTSLLAAGGIFATFSLTQKLKIEPHLMFGYANVESPYFKAYNLDGPSGYPSLIEQEKKGTRSLMFLIRFVFSYELNDKWCILTNFDFFATNFRFEERQTQTNIGTEHHSFTQKIRTLNFSFGIGYQF